jgi:hypothetical protein
MQVSAPKCPSSFDVDATEVDNDAANLQEFLINNKKMLGSASKLLLQLHLKSIKEFGSGQQDVTFLESKKQQNKSKLLDGPEKSGDRAGKEMGIGGRRVKGSIFELQRGCTAVETYCGLHGKACCSIFSGCS